MEQERILDVENKKMEDSSAQNHALQDNLNAWYSQLNTISEEYNRELAITEEDLKRQTFEEAQSARSQAIQDSREQLRRLAQHD